MDGADQLKVLVKAPPYTATTLGRRRLIVPSLVAV